MAKVIIRPIKHSITIGGRGEEIEENSRTFFPTGGKRWKILEGEKAREHATHIFEWKGWSGYCRRRQKCKK